MNNLYKSMLETAENAGIKILSDDYCCQLLAWLYVHGGAIEMVVFNLKMYMDIKAAQKRLNLFGAEIPNTLLLKKVQDYTKEAEQGVKENTHPDWVLKICEKYAINKNLL